jgi:hypothetical protein
LHALACSTIWRRSEDPLGVKIVREEPRIAGANALDRFTEPVSRPPQLCADPGANLRLASAGRAHLRLERVDLRPRLAQAT